MVSWAYCPSPALSPPLLSSYSANDCTCTPLVTRGYSLSVPCIASCVPSLTTKNGGQWEPGVLSSTRLHSLESPSTTAEASSAVKTEGADMGEDASLNSSWLPMVGTANQYKKLLFFRSAKEMSKKRRRSSGRPIARPQTMPSRHISCASFARVVGLSSSRKA